MKERYRILRRLGQGGMAEVYLAEHLGLGRYEALKVLRSTMEDDPEFVLRFRREARATSRVQHPNIVRVYDFGRLGDGRFFLAMELVEGESLEAMLAREGAQPIARTLHLLTQLASAVHQAHACHVLHRDLKPANLMLVAPPASPGRRGPQDVLKVLDFGLAKIISPDAEGGFTSRAGEVFGTPLYMAPEQFLGRGVDGRSDVYAIGCIAYELLTGAPPFAGTNLELMEAHLAQVPAHPRSGRPNAAPLPASLAELVLRCLEKSAARRFQTADELRQRLEREARSLTSDAP